MNALARNLSADTPRVMTPRRLVGAYLAEARSECLRYVRMPSFMIPLLCFSSVFYIFFGVVMAPNMGPGASRYFLASYSVFGIMAPGLFGFGVSLAAERDNGLLTLKRALPMPPGAYLIGKMVMAMAAVALVMTLMLLLGALLGGITMSTGLVLGMLAMGIIGVLPFCALGMWIGTLAKGQAAPGVVNLVYLPMAFLSGLWIPLPVLPEALQQVAVIFPSYHLDRIALNAVGLQHAPLGWHVLMLAGCTVAFTGLAMRRLRRHG